MKQSNVIRTAATIFLGFALQIGLTNDADATSLKLKKKPQTRGAYRAELDALIKDNAVACKAASDCTSIGVGSRSCGGPSEYVILSKGTKSKIDSAITDLTKTIAELDATANSGMAGTCDVMVEPEVTCKASKCVAGGSQI